MTEIEITDEMLLVARKKARELGKLKNSITGGIGNLIGFVGEQVALKHFTEIGHDVNYTSTFDYDMIVDGKKVDVKTKSTSVAPLPHYSSSIANYNTKQDCDYYAFVRVKKDLTVGWWCGVYSKEQFFKNAKFMKKGEVDDDNKFVIKADCYNLPLSVLEEKL